MFLIMVLNTDLSDTPNKLRECLTKLLGFSRLGVILLVSRCLVTF